ncbi:MAG: hypothetical protein L3J39_08555 [Verrucomicrobiales bacterium]|nr:hypothetical protein [Verrucomicrobiales bacterium]
MKKTLPLACSFALLFITACSTSPSVKHHHWLPTSPAEPAEKSAKPSRSLAQNTQLLSSQIKALQHLSSSFSALQKNLEQRPHPYFSAEQSDQAGLLLLRYQQSHDELQQIILDARSYPNDKSKAAILGQSASANLSWLESDIAARFHHHPITHKFLDSSFPHYEVPRDSYSTLVKNVTNPNHIHSLTSAQAELPKQLKSTPSLAQLRRTNSSYARLIEQLPSLYTRTAANIRTLLGEHTPQKLASLENQVRHSKAADAGRKLNQKIDAQLYTARGHLFKGVARIKNPAKSIVRFSPSQIKQIQNLLQPGDILLSFTEGYMSSVFLPGKFKHGITYIGTRKERQQLGLSDHYLRQHAINEQQAHHLVQQANIKRLASGEQIDVIESIAEGVRLYSLKKLLKTHINRLAVLRPRFTPEQTRKQLTDTFRYVGTPYDFRYDFSDATRNCCTELTYRTLEKNGDFNFKLTKQRAHWVLTADDIINYHLDTNPKAFDFILLAEEGPAQGKYNATILTGKQAETRTRQLMK